MSLSCVITILIQVANTYTVHASRSLIALMLGRLRMCIDDAIAAYVELSKDIFSKKQSFRDGKYSAKGLEAAVKKIVEEHAGDTGPGIMDPVPEDKICRT